MISTTQLQLVLVTPERTLSDVPVRGLQFPLYDGQIGILPQRAPLVGRLGYGELLITHVDGKTERYFIDGGFVQVKGSVVSLLTNRALRPEAVDVTAADEALQQALAMTPHTAEEFRLRQETEDRSRALKAFSRRS